MSILNQFSLEGKTALVTGCKRGIGKAIAIGLAKAGADIIGVSASLESAESAVEKVIMAAGKEFKAYSCDFADRQALYKFIELVNAGPQPIDILVNNAGTIKRAPANEHPDSFWDEVIEVNQTAQFILTREFGNRMLQRGTGKVIFMASMLSFQGGLNVPGYAASKGAIAQMTKAFANEWAARGVAVNAIAPGYIATDNTAALKADKERSRSIIERIPADRWGIPEDLVGAAIFLASSASDYVNGTILPVDGGWLGR